MNIDPSISPNYGLSKSKEEGLDQSTWIDPLPRSVLRPNTFILLDGEWKFEFDIKDEGLAAGWHLAHQYTQHAIWPGSVEEHIMKNSKSEKPWEDRYVAWYEREFPMPVLDEHIKREQLQLTFGACGYETRVWLNGHPLKTIEGELIHHGEYTSFSYELSDHLLQKENRLTVRISGSMDADIPRGKQESHVYKRGGIWYQTFTGAVRSAWIEAVERNRLRSRVGVVSFVEDDLVRLNITTRIHDAGPYKIRILVYEDNHDEFEPVATDEFDLLLEAGQKEQRLVVEIPGAVLWSVDNPHLYKLVAQLISEDGHIAEIQTKFGLRKIEARGRFIYLNNRKIYLDGILYQPGVATYEQIKRHMYAMKALGCNLVRIHITGIDPRIYKLADKLGLLLWLEVPSPHSSSATSRTNHREELMRMLALIGTHPSVIIWSLYNEDWGVQDIATNKEVRSYITGIYHYMQIAFPQFLVVDNDGWQHISYKGRLKSDLLTAHLYTADLERWKTLLDELVAGKLIGVAAFPLVVGDPFFYRKQVPLLVSEWGGFGFPNYGGPKDGVERSQQIKLFKNELRKRQIAGDVYTQATNIEDEQNGIIDFLTGELKVEEGLLGTDLNEKYKK